VTRCDAPDCNGVGGGTGGDATFTSANIAAGGGSTFSHTFHGAGTYHYYCQVHGYFVMHGTITVLAATPPTTSAPTPTTVSSGSPATTAAPASGSPGSNTSPTTATGTSPTTVATAPGTLAHTGAASAVWTAVGVGLVVVGLALLGGLRRRATR
jgi:LPXTG-motif cell wall-anchored protein